MPYSFEVYDEKASTYTSLRRPIGVEREAAHFLSDPALKDMASGGMPLAAHGLRLLDSGCGTGNYSRELIAAFGFREVHCSDYNGAMVQEAQKNIVERANAAGISADKVTFSTDNICDMPAMKSEYYDCVCNNQVVHHLRPDNDFSDLRAACKEWYRVLKPGGCIAINLTPGENQRIGMFWAELIPEANAICGARMPTVETMTSALQGAGFADVIAEPLFEEVLYDPELYFKPENLLDWDRFMRSDSTFNLVEPAEKERALARMRQMLEEGTLAAWFAKKEEERLQVGQSVTVFARKV